VFFPKATTGLEPIGYRGALLSSLLQVNVYVTHILLNVLVQIANKMGFKKKTIIEVELFRPCLLSEPLHSNGCCTFAYSAVVA
jgi:hypothetical protein